MGGIAGATDYELFDLPDEAALDALVSDEIDVVSAYLASKAGTNYTQTADTGLQTRFRRGEAYRTLCELFEPLKAKKILGTHAPYDSEESASYQRLIDEEWGPRAETYIGEFIADDTGGPYSAGVFITSSPFDRITDVDCVTDRNQEILDAATCSSSLTGSGNTWTG